jgi:hypothetical protein
MFKAPTLMHDAVIATNTGATYNDPDVRLQATGNINLDVWAPTGSPTFSMQPAQSNDGALV